MAATLLSNEVNRRIPHEDKIVVVDLIPPGTLRLRAKTPRRDDEEIVAEFPILDLMEKKTPTSTPASAVSDDMYYDLETVVIGHPMLDEKDSIRLWKVVREMRTGAWPEENETP